MGDITLELRGALQKKKKTLWRRRTNDDELEFSDGRR